MKIILKIITLYLIVLLASCEAEKIITHTGQKSYDSQKISLSKFLEETGENNFEPIVRIKYHSVNISGKSTNSKYDLIDFDIDTNVINSMMVFNKNTYTFRVKPKDYTGTNLFNLIYYKKNNTWEKTILEMKPTADNLYKLQNGLTTKFEGEIKQILSSEKTTIKSKSTSREGCSLFTIIVKDCHGCVGKCDECLICWTYTSFFLYDSGGGDSGGGGGDFSSGVGPNQGAGGSSYSFPDANAPDTTFFEPNTNNLQGELDEIYATKFNEFINSLQSTNITSFNYLNQNPTVKNQIRNYLKNNNLSEESTIFTKELIDSSRLLEINSMEVWNDYNKFVSQMSISEKAIFENQLANRKLWYMVSAKKAFDKANELYPNSTHNGKGDAFRHALWNGLCALTLAGNLGEQLTTAHENKPSQYTYNYKETEMDLYNNQKGRQIALISNLRNLTDNVLQYLNNGYLRYLNNLTQSVDPQLNNLATFNSILIPTDQ